MTRVTSDLPTTGSQPVFDKQLTWDAQGRVTALADLANSALNAAYGYDALDRISSVAQGASSWGYAYNATGDRTASSVGSALTRTTYAYNAAGQLATVTTHPG